MSNNIQPASISDSISLSALNPWSWGSALSDFDYLNMAQWTAHFIPVAKQVAELAGCYQPFTTFPILENIAVTLTSGLAGKVLREWDLAALSSSQSNTLACLSFGDTKCHGSLNSKGALWGILAEMVKKNSPTDPGALKKEIMDMIKIKPEFKESVSKEEIFNALDQYMKLNEQMGKALEAKNTATHQMNFQEEQQVASSKTLNYYQTKFRELYTIAENAHEPVVPVKQKAGVSFGASETVAFDRADRPIAVDAKNAVPTETKSIIKRLNTNWLDSVGNPNLLGMSSEEQLKAYQKGLDDLTAELQKQVIQVVEEFKKRLVAGNKKFTWSEVKQAISDKTHIQDRGLLENIVSLFNHQNKPMDGDNVQLDFNVLATSIKSDGTLFPPVIGRTLANSIVDKTKEILHRTKNGISLEGFVRELISSNGEDGRLPTVDLDPEIAKALAISFIFKPGETGGDLKLGSMSDENQLLEKLSDRALLLSNLHMKRFANEVMALEANKDLSKQKLLGANHEYTQVQNEAFKVQADIGKKTKKSPLDPSGYDEKAEGWSESSPAGKMKKYQEVAKQPSGFFTAAKLADLIQYFMVFQRLSDFIDEQRSYQKIRKDVKKLSNN